MPPKHQNPTQHNRIARAPYNFVPVAERILVFRNDTEHPFRPQVHYDGRRATGWIDVQLETVTPIYVRGPLTPEDYKKLEEQEANPKDPTPHLDRIRNRPAFFHTGDATHPAIPGSSLRGMLRTLVEILGHGKLQPVSDLALAYRSIADEWYRQQLMSEEPSQRNHFTPLFRGGYVREDGGNWYIQPAQETNGATYARISHKRLNTVRDGLKPWHNCKSARHIFIQPGPHDFQEVRGGFIHIRYTKVVEASLKQTANTPIEAVLAESGKMNSKRSEAVIFSADDRTSVGKGWIRIPNGTLSNEPDLVGAYQNQISDEQQRLLGAEGVLQDHHPVFYLLDQRGQLIFFGHTQMFRLPYSFSPEKLLHPIHANHEVLDLAETMFGTVRGEEGGQAGRVFVTDAVLDNGQGNVFLSDKALIPKILSSPKPTTIQHYLTQDQPNDRNTVRTYRDGPRRTTLRGHKLYWHKNQRVNTIQGGRYLFEETASIDSRNDKQHTKFFPVKAGIKFHFRVYFDNLTLPELGLLWWALSLPVSEKQRPDYCHKIGMGKPYGLGTVRLTPQLTLINLKVRYESLFEGRGKSMQWCEGRATDNQRGSILDAALREFELLVNDVQPDDLKGTTFERLPRITMLLKMLQWPGPVDNVTRYLEIERPDSQDKRGKRNEYRDRPVLPDPLHTEQVKDE